MNLLLILGNNCSYFFPSEWIVTWFIPFCIHVKYISRHFGTNSNLNTRQQKVLLYLREGERASVEEIRQKYNLVRRTVQRDLSKMVDLGLIKEIAKSKTDPTRYSELLSIDLNQYEAWLAY